MSDNSIGLSSNFDPSRYTSPQGSSSPTTRQSSPQPGETYTVVSGDSMSKIWRDHAQQQGVSWEAFQAANGAIMNDAHHGNLIHPGDQVTIPKPDFVSKGGAAATSARTAPTAAEASAANVGRVNPNLLTNPGRFFNASSSGAASSLTLNSRANNGHGAYETQIDIDPAAAKLIKDKGWSIDPKKRTLIGPAGTAIDLAGGREPGAPTTQRWALSVANGQLHGRYEQEGKSETVNLSVSANPEFRQIAEQAMASENQRLAMGGTPMPADKQQSLARAVNGGLLTDRDLAVLRRPM